METEMKNKEEAIKHIGVLLKNSPMLHDIEQQVGFNLHSITFFQRLISEELIHKSVRIESENFYKGLICLDYFCGVIEDYYKACDLLIDISKALREAEKKEGKIHNGKASYLNLETIVEVIGFCAKERGKDYYSTKSNTEAIRKRYESKKEKVDFNSDSIKKADPYYEAIGLMVYDLVDDERKEILGEVASRTDLGAIIFTDCILQVIKDKDYKTKAEDSLNKKEYFGASLTALDGLSKEASKSKIESFIIGGKNITEEKNGR